MLANLIIAFLVTLLLLVGGSILYLLSVVVSDADSDSNQLGLDAHDFSSSPVVSPNDNVVTAADYYLAPDQPASTSVPAIEGAKDQPTTSADPRPSDPLSGTGGASAVPGSKRSSGASGAGNARSERGRSDTALHSAVRRNRLPSLIELLCGGADTEARNEAGETALILAARLSNIFACQLLLVFDCDPNAVDKRGQSARHLAASACDRRRDAQQPPSASHLILAMLSELGARRCPPEVSNLSALDSTTNSKQVLPACADGCLANGQYNGNSYARWSNYATESLYKKYMFTELVESMLKRKSASAGHANSLGLASRIWSLLVGGGAANNNDQPKQQRSSRLLSIDGGGLRGVIICEILIELGKHLKRPVISYFDWVGGTSVGAFLACALCQGRSLNEMRRICFDFKDEVFNGQRPYSSQFLERVLRRTYGSRARMSDIKSHHLAVTTTLADRDPCQLRFFRNYQSPCHLLEAHGYSAELFNSMSAHSRVDRRPAATGSPVSVAEQSNTKQSGCVARAQSKTAAAAVGTAAAADAATATATATATSAEAATTKEVAAKAPTNNSASNKCEPSYSQEATNKNLDDFDDELDALPTLQTGVRTATSGTRDDGSEMSRIGRLVSDRDADPLIWQAVRASAAAPFFFKPYGPFLDGGIISNNPTLDLLAEFESYQRVRAFLRNQNKLEPADESANKLSLVVSLGTGRGRVIGRQAIIDFGQVASGFATVFSPVELVRSIKAARELFKKLIQQSCHTEDHILDRAQAWCSSLGIPYFRINPPLATTFSIDDKRDEQLINAMWQTKLYMRSMKDQLVQLAQLLEEG